MQLVSGLVEGDPVHGRGFGIRWSLRTFPTQTILCFYQWHTLVFGQSWSSQDCMIFVGSF